MNEFALYDADNAQFRSCEFIAKIWEHAGTRYDCQTCSDDNAI